MEPPSGPFGSLGPGSEWMDVGYAAAVQRWTKVRRPLRHNMVTTTLLSTRDRRLQTAAGERVNPLGAGLACGQQVPLDQCQYLRGHKQVTTDAYSIVDANTQFSSVQLLSRV